jgi:CHAT domain-containing protein/tetratricopeptide (TPR) repeat protein
MRLFILCSIIFFSLFISYSQISIEPKNNLKTYLLGEKYFNDAYKISTEIDYNEDKEIELNKKALKIFQKLNQQLIIDKEDSLAFFCHYKTAILYHYFDSLNLAKSEYFKTIELRNKITSIPDSFLFQPFLFLGRILYSQNKFDSSYIFYKKAENISDKYKTKLNEEERLYNGLGSMFYETGNYKQAKNYYEKAISVLDLKDETNNDFLIRYKSNIASSLLKLERFKEADSIYNSLIHFKKNTNEIFQNLGSIQLQLGLPEKALSYFKKVKYNNALNILLYNKIAKSYLLLEKKDSSEKYIQISLRENDRWNGNKKNILHGLTLQEIAEKFIFEKKYKEAINSYQKAIIQFYPDYNEINIYKNPETFSGVFSYINLFNNLTEKANTFEKLYGQDKKQTSLDAALNAYQSAFLLADYVEKTYDSDDARLFLNKIKYNVHDRPIHISLELYELTKNKTYLQEAYNFDQQNKASVLSLNAQESAIKSEFSSNVMLFEKETSIKSNITRLSLKASQINDGIQLQKIKTDILDYEIELDKLQDKINELPGYKAKKFAKLIPSVAQVQKLLSKKTTLLSYHLAENELVILCISANDFSYTKQAIDSTFFTTVKSLKTSLNNYRGEEKYDGTATSIVLYNTIIKPILSKIKNAENLLIIPDDELNNLPFEALNDEKGNFVLDKFNVQYQYSTVLLRDDVKSNATNKITLAMAPFASKGSYEFSKLLYSKNEIENLKGNILMDSTATKKNFLALAEKAGILHLATHTIINDSIPEKSLIAFYPFTGLSPSENNLYLQEIYNLKLDATKLVILSACETGTGQLAKGEGLMSLSRAFTYAGCPNIIASLWKANDKSTAWIMQRFYRYYNDGTNAAAALQKAKLDYIQSPEIEKRFKSPNYWAHLVLTGVPEHKTSLSVWLWAVGIISILLFGIFYFYKKQRKKVTLISSI